MTKYFIDSPFSCSTEEAAATLNGGKKATIEWVLLVPF